MPPRVTIVTPTIGRPTLTTRGIPSVEAQTANVEHIVVYDGPIVNRPPAPTSGIRLVTHMAASDPRLCGAAAFNRGCAIGGEWLFPFPDDDLLVPHAIERMQAALAESGADFAYSQAAMVFDDDPMTVEGARWICGKEPPQFGGITNFLFRHRLLDIAKAPETYIEGGNPCWDWLLVEAWLKGGAEWVFVPEVLQVHHVDHA